MSQPPYADRIEHQSEEKGTMYSRLLYHGQQFEVRPSHCKCPAPEIVPIGRPVVGRQALPASPNGTMIEGVLNWGGKLVQADDASKKSDKLSREKLEIGIIGNEAQLLQEKVDSFRQYRKKIAQDVGSTTYGTAAAQIQHFGLLERQLRQKLESIQEDKAKLMERFRQLKEWQGLPTNSEWTSLLQVAERRVETACSAAGKA